MNETSKLGTVPLGSLKAFLDTKKQQNRILGPARRHYDVKRPDRDSGRSSLVLHPSEISGKRWCDRESWYLLNGRPKTPERLTQRMDAIFETGHAAHARWQQLYADMGVLWGQWVDPATGLRLHPLTPQALPGDSTPLAANTPVGPRPPDRPDAQYGEIALASGPEHRIAGHCDGLIVGLGQPVLLEVKTLGPGTFRAHAPRLAALGGVEDAWAALEKPFHEHVKQASLYVWMLNGMRLPRVPEVGEIAFIYELKANQDSREFVVEYSEQTIEPILERAARISASARPVPCPHGGCAKCRPHDDAV